MDEIAFLKKRIEQLEAHNQLLASKLQERLKHPTASLQEMADSRDSAWIECEKMRQRFVWALQQNDRNNNANSSPNY